MKDFKDLNKWRDKLCLKIGRINIAKKKKKSILPKLPYKLNEIPIKSQQKISYKDYSKVYIEKQRKQNS